MHANVFRDTVSQGKSSILVHITYYPYIIITFYSPLYTPHFLALDQKPSQQHYTNIHLVRYRLPIRLLYCATAGLSSTTRFCMLLGLGTLLLRCMSSSFETKLLCFVEKVVALGVSVLCSFCSRSFSSGYHTKKCGCVIPVLCRFVVELSWL